MGEERISRVYKLRRILQRIREKIKDIFVTRVVKHKRKNY
jgi:hypothetical protein